MFTRLIRLAGLCLLPLLAAAGARADTIYLTNNKTIVGIVDIATSEGTHVTVKTPTSVQRIPRAKILRIERDKQASHTEVSGDLAASDNDLDRALELYQKALANDPANEKLVKKIDDMRARIRERDRKAYGAKFDEIRQMIAAGRYDEAIAAAKAIQAASPEESVKRACKQLISQVYLIVARGHRDQINMTGAEKYYNLAMQTFPDDPTAHLELADLLRSMSAAGKTLAIPLYQKGIDLAMRNQGGDYPLLDEDRLLEYRFNLDKLYFEDQKFDQAAAMFIDITRDDKNFRFPEAVDFAVESYYKLQEGNSGTGPELEKIIENLKSIIGIKPHEDRAQFLLGRIYFSREDWQNAREMMAAAVANASPAASKQALQEALFYLGISSLKLNRVNDAAQAFERLIAIQPNNYEAICELANIRLEQAVYQQAYDLSQQAISIDKDKYRAWLMAGKALQKLARYEEARRSLREVVARDPANFEAQLNIGDTYIIEQQWDPAIVELQRTIEIIEADPERKTDPKNTPLLARAYTLMGTANLNLKNYARAREIFQIALKSDPAHAAALDGIGRTHQAEGHHVDAQDFFEKAIAADPANPDYYLSRAVNFHNYLKSPEKALPFYQEYLKRGGKDARVKGWIIDCGGTPPQ